MFDWSTGSGNTPSSNTGPNSDHTLGSKAGKYLFIETSASRKPGDTARLRSSTMTKPPGHCKLTFYYHMHGSNIGSVSVYVNQTGSSRAVPIWSATGDHGDAWRLAEATIGATDSYQVTVAVFKF